MSDTAANHTTPKRYTITAALPYTNGGVHIGHLAGVYIPADIYARYLRMQQRDVIFVCGSDENGVPITLRAKKENITPQQLVDKYHKIIGDSFAAFGISFDIYHRTSSAMHKHTAQEFFTQLYDKGIFTEEVTEQYYDNEAGQFLADRYITGTCPKCGNEGAYGDQCESCGSSLNATDLISPKSTLSGSTPVLKETKNWLLPLNNFEEQLKAYITGHPEWKPNVYGQCMSWLNAGLQPRAMTRDLSWGVPVPLPGADGKVLYVWFDAPIGYISATKELFNPQLTPEQQQLYYMQAPHAGRWQDYWTGTDTKLVHFIGKDNIVFHCIIFPAMLMAQGEYTLADNVPANEFLNLEGQKISTSKNWAVWLDEYLVDFPDKQDVLRYVLTATAPETKDNDFTWKDFQARNNNELVAILGNFFNRVTVLCQKYYNGLAPQPAGYNAYDDETLAELNRLGQRVGQAIEQYRFREALTEVMNMARLGNKYLADEEPWKLIKTDEERVKTIMFIALQIAAKTAVALQPFLPFTAQKMYSAMAMQQPAWAMLQQAVIVQPGTQLQAAPLLFTKLEDAEIERQIAKLQASKPQQAAEVQPHKPDIDFESFEPLDIRVATITAAEKVAKTKKLLKLTVSTGTDVRTVVSGIAEHYSPDDIIGRQVCLLANLAPKMLKGIESQGMILMAEEPKGKLIFISPQMLAQEGSIVR